MSYWYNGEQTPQVFEYDPKTGDMVLRFGDGRNDSAFDDFRSLLENSDLELDKDVRPPLPDYSSLQNYDPDKETFIDQNTEINFSISTRSNIKRKFRFYDTWEANPRHIWMREEKGVKTFHNDRGYGHWREEAKGIIWEQIDSSSEDWPESEPDINIYKKTNTNADYLLRRTVVRF